MSDPAAPLQLSARIAPLLAGHPPAVQGCALADLLSIWLAGHPPQAREELLAAHIRAVRALVPVSEAQASAYGSPWKMQQH